MQFVNPRNLLFVARLQRRGQQQHHLAHAHDRPHTPLPQLTEIEREEIEMQKEEEQRQRILGNRYSSSRKPWTCNRSAPQEQ